MAKTQETPVSEARRDFLKLATVGAPVAAAATALGGSEALAEAPPTQLGYRKTEHVKAYLASCRF